MFDDNLTSSEEIVSCDRDNILQSDQILTPTVLSQDNEIDWLSLLNETISCIPNIPQSHRSEALTLSNILTIPTFDDNLTLSAEIVSYDRENILQSDQILTPTVLSQDNEIDWFNVINL